MKEISWPKKNKKMLKSLFDLEKKKVYNTLTYASYMEVFWLTF